VESAERRKAGGEEVVQLYMKRRGEQGAVPIRSLEGSSESRSSRARKKFVNSS